MGHRARETRYEVILLFRDSQIVLTQFVVLIFDISDTVRVKTLQKAFAQVSGENRQVNGENVLQITS